MRDSVVLKMTNKSKNFYEYMGKIFGSRIIQNQTNDRIYDDDNKIWYVALEDDRAMAFVSVVNDVIKNVYASKEKCLTKVLTAVKNDIKIKPSTVTNLYVDIYKNAEYNVEEPDTYKNFVVIS